MSRIVTQDKLNELTGKSIDYGRGGGILPTLRPVNVLMGTSS